MQSSCIPLYAYLKIVYQLAATEEYEWLPGGHAMQPSCPPLYAYLKIVYQLAATEEYVRLPGGHAVQSSCIPLYVPSGQGRHQLLWFPS